ncbi:HNH endonuclease, partial [Roseateles sp. GG27B]
MAFLARQSDKPTLWKRSTGRPGNFKRDLTISLKSGQDRRCAYCGSFLFEKYPHRDHIAPKERYPDWTFRPDNLVLACYACN